MFEGGEMVFQTSSADAFGHNKLGGIGDLVSEELTHLSPKFNHGKKIETINQKLAYLVRKFSDGNYVLLTLEAGGPVVLELERRLRVSEPVIKFITVRMDEEEKRLAKVKALRASRRKLSAEPHAPAALPVAAEPAEPAQASA